VHHLQIYSLQKGVPVFAKMPPPGDTAGLHPVVDMIAKGFDLIKLDNEFICAIIYDIMRVVLNTNVLISALYSKRGASYALLIECLSGAISYAVSPLIAFEYEGKIHESIFYSPLTRGS
jgi:hypothetical protein